VPASTLDPPERAARLVQPLRAALDELERRFGVALGVRRCCCCGADLPAGSRPERRFCSVRCKKRDESRRRRRNYGYRLAEAQRHRRYRERLAAAAATNGGATNRRPAGPELAELAGRIGKPLALVESLVAQEVRAGRIVRAQDGRLRLNAARVPPDLLDALRGLTTPANGAGANGGGVHLVDRVG
jgi:hypothetical protein